MKKMTFYLTFANVCQAIERHGLQSHQYKIVARFDGTWVLSLY